jgi:hypothetical protein
VVYILQHEIDLYDEGQDGALDREEIVEVSRQLRRLKEDL